MASDIQTMFVPFGELRPDSGEFMNADLVETNGVFPMGDMYFPLQPMASRSDLVGTGADPSIVRGHINQSSLVDSDDKASKAFNTGNLYVAVDGVLYGLTDNVDPWPVSTLSGALTMDANGAQFCGFGQHEIFACGHTSPMQIRLLGAGNFVDCITNHAAGSDPRPKFVCVIGERILAANFGNCVLAGVGTPDVNQNLAWWSATRNPQTFGTAASNPADRTDYNFLYDDFGDIMGLAGNREYALIFKRRAIVRMDFGGAYGFTFRWIPQSIGTISHLSICQLGRDTFFWGDPGPCVYRDDQVIPLAYGKIALKILAEGFFNVNLMPAIVGSGADPVNNLVWWDYTYTTEANQARFAKLVYSPITDRFSLAQDAPLEPTTFTVNSDGANLKANQIVGSWGGLNLTGLPLASAVIALQDYQNNRLVLHSFSGTDGKKYWVNPLRMVTGYFAPAQKAATVVQRIRPVVRMKSGATVPDLRVTVNVKNKPWEAPTPFGPFALSTHGDGRGFITCPGVGAAQLIQVVLEAGYPGNNGTFSEANLFSSIREIEGVQIEHYQTGKGT